ncbi:sulfur oxidation c-type cytochrome SoxX [Arcobacter sp. FWKO B]|uniref:sulfur oxidation c-type cytochrome SoxX n=1 Tax=Arcobacter sp. FWKO B TaxID=2593672 RepID=UPI001D18E71C|nr:sulfur oxidation c-type cytochrome SoxX [Arcobacter sp. FWKO B]
MMTRKKLFVFCWSLAVIAYANGFADLNASQKIEVEMPDAKAILDKDWLKETRTYVMPDKCVTKDSKSIKRGEFFFHNLSGATVSKASVPEGVATEDGKNIKPYGNCVACHNIENAIGAGNIGPDLTGYKANFVDSGVRDAKWVYQKIADPRVDSPHTYMIVSGTTGLFNEEEMCDLVSYLLRD